MADVYRMTVHGSEFIINHNSGGTVGVYETEKESLEDVLLSVWRQAMAEGASCVEIEGHTYPAKCTPRRGLKQVDFRFGGRDLRGLEQNPDTKSRWAAMARAGKKVMQFLDGGRYVAVVCDGKVKMYQKQF
jgi:hypothetical protein